MNPFFSVIIPVYNTEDYLERCIQSFLKQKFKDYEMILVNDGSTDSSGAICDNYAAEYSHIRVVHKKNGGLSSARNAGTQEALGEYIWWVDADDWVDENSLAMLYDAAKKTRADFVKFNYVRVINREKTECFSNALPGLYRGSAEKEGLLQKALLQPANYSLSACFHIYRRQFLKDEQLSFISEREIGSEDYLLNLQALLVADSIFVINRSFYYYELRMGSLTQRHKEDSPLKYTELYKQLCEFYRQKGALERYERQICTFYVWHLLHGICIPNEYRTSENHTLADGRKRITEFLQFPEFKQAIKHVRLGDFSRKQSLQLLAMRWHMEPLFYYLYVVKPGRLKG